MTTRMFDNINGLLYELPVPPELQNSCLFLSPTCPIAVGSIHEFSVIMALTGNIQGAHHLEMALFGDNNEPITCAGVDIIFS